MSRSTLRIVAVIVLALLGAPVAMHVVIHDLHEHHHEQASASEPESGQSNHEHPVVSSPAPPVPNLTRMALPVAPAPVATATTWPQITRAERNVLSFGALRTDTDVGFQPLLATFLI